MARSGAFVVLLLSVALLAEPFAVGAITCGQVAGALVKCVPYLTGKVPTVPEACCGGVRSLNSAAKTTADRQAACSCLKSLASSNNGLQSGKATGLPGQCGVRIPYAISPSTDCSKVT